MSILSPSDPITAQDRALLERAIAIALAPGAADPAAEVIRRLQVGGVNASRAACLRLLESRPRRSRELLRLLDVLDEALDAADREAKRAD